MSLINNTIWATVSMSTIKATPIWQKYSDDSGNISKDRHKHVLKAALVYLGYDEKAGNYSREENVNIRSNEDRKFVYANTTLYTFPVRNNYAYKKMYQRNDIIHAGAEDFSGWGRSHFKMEDFGNEHDPSKEESDLD